MPVLLLPGAHVRQERSEYTLFSMLIRARTGTTHGNCSGSYVTYFQRDEVKRAGARDNSRAGLAFPFPTKLIVSTLKIQVQQTYTN